MSKHFDSLLDFWVKNNMNVLLSGEHGFGKTAVVGNTFERNGMRWKYFSAATMDPWVDLVGVPKEHTDDNGQTYLKLIRPKEFQNDEYDAIFFDEFNRCVTGDTVIPLLDGTSVAIKDLIGREEFFVYAFDQNTRSIKVARGHSARKTLRNEQLVKITLDNGRYFKCTPDHPILNFDGKFVRADSLIEGQSLLPLYRVWDSIKQNLSGYEWVWQPKKNSKWELKLREQNGNHRIVSIEACPNEDVYDITVDEYENFAIDCGIFVHNSPKKVRNAVMELIQFKSINGHKFNNLKVVWAAINPHDEEETYDVEKLDPAQIDRFHVLYQVPSVPDKDFFYKKYGQAVGKAAIEWWHAIPDTARKLVSARRLEYALDCYQSGGDIKYLVHASTNPSKLVMVLNSGSVIDKLRQILNDNDTKALIAFLKKDNQFDVAVELMKDDFGTIDAIIPFVDEERLMRLTHDVRGVREFVTKFENIDRYADMLKAVLNAGTLDKKEDARIRAILSRGVVSNSKGVIVYEPQQGSAIYNQQETYDQISLYISSLIAADSGELLKAYDFLNLNLCAPPNLTSAINALCVMFRFIDGEKNDMLVTRYTKLIPMINFIIEWMSEKSNTKINDPAIRTYFTQGNRKLRSVVKVQGFIDSNHSSFITKPRLM